jgi:hypothetical protein
MRRFDAEYQRLRSLIASGSRQVKTCRHPNAPVTRYPSPEPEGEQVHHPARIFRRHEARSGQNQIALHL